MKRKVLKVIFIVLATFCMMPACVNANGNYTVSAEIDNKMSNGKAWVDYRIEKENDDEITPEIISATFDEEGRYLGGYIVSTNMDYTGKDSFRVPIDIQYLGFERKVLKCKVFLWNNQNGQMPLSEAKTFNVEFKYGTSSGGGSGGGSSGGISAASVEINE